MPGAPLKIDVDPLSVPSKTGAPANFKFPNAPKILAPSAPTPVVVSEAVKPTIEYWTVPGAEPQPLDWFFNKAKKSDAAETGIGTVKPLKSTSKGQLDTGNHWDGGPFKSLNNGGWADILDNFDEYNVTQSLNKVNLGLEVSEEAINQIGKLHNLSPQDLDFFVNPPVVPGTLGETLEGFSTFEAWFQQLDEVIKPGGEIWETFSAYSLNGELLAPGVFTNKMEDAYQWLDELHSYSKKVNENVKALAVRMEELKSLPHPASPSWDNLGADQINKLIDTAAMHHKVNDQVVELLNVIMKTDEKEALWGQMTGTQNANKWWNPTQMAELEDVLEKAVKDKGLNEPKLLNFTKLHNKLNNIDSDDVADFILGEDKYITPNGFKAPKNEALKLAYAEKLGTIGNEKEMLWAKYGNLLSPKPTGSPKYNSEFVLELFPNGKLYNQVGDIADNDIFGSTNKFKDFITESNINNEFLDSDSVFTDPWSQKDITISLSSKNQPKSLVNVETKLAPTPPPSAKPPAAKKPAPKKPAAKKPTKKPSEKTPDDLSQGQVNSMASQPYEPDELPFGLDSDQLIEHKALGAELGGQNPKKVYVNPKNKEQWIFKPQERWQAELEAATAHLQQSLGLPGPVVKVVNIDGQIGSLHEVLGKTLDQTEALFKGKKFDGTKLSTLQLEAMEQNYLFDYLISNYDAHNENFLRYKSLLDKELLPVGIDKGQAFKHFGSKGEADALLDWLYNPNANNPSKMPYGEMFEQFAKGDIPGLPFAEQSAKLQNTIATAKYLAESGRLDDILRPYAEAAIQAGKLKAKNADEFIASITERFATIDKKWIEFEDALLKTEGGKPKLLLQEAKEKIANIDLEDPSDFKIMSPQMATRRFAKRTEALERKHKYAVSRYTGSWFSTANTALRKSRDDIRGLVDDLTESDLGTLASLDDAFEKIGPLGQNVRVHRGTNFISNEFGQQIDSALINQNPESLVGSVIQDYGYTSTSVGGDPAFMGQWILELDVPADVKAIYARPLSGFKKENELILERGLNFVVTDVQMTGGPNKQKLIKAQVLPRGKHVDIIEDADAPDLSSWT